MIIYYGCSYEGDNLKRIVESFNNKLMLKDVNKCEISLLIMVNRVTIRLKVYFPYGSQSITLLSKDIKDCSLHDLAILCRCLHNTGSPLEFNLIRFSHLRLKFIEGVCEKFGLNLTYKKAPTFNTINKDHFISALSNWEFIVRFEAAFQDISGMYRVVIQNVDEKDEELSKVLGILFREELKYWEELVYMRG